MIAYVHILIALKYLFAVLFGVAVFLTKLGNSQLVSKCPVDQVKGQLDFVTNRISEEQKLF